MRKLILALAALFAAPAAAQVNTQPVAVPIASAGAASGVVIRAGGGQVNSINIVNGATAGWAVLYDSATLPADGTLNAAMIRWCLPIGVNTGLRDTFAAPLYFYNGLTTFVSSTSCTTKAAVAYGYAAAQVK